MSVPTTPDDATTQRLRDRLVEDLVRDGDLRSPAWKDAVAHVPRHVFLPSFHAPPTNGVWTLVTPERVGTKSWLDRVYSNETWVTQFNGDPADGASSDQPATGIPTSSSTMPGLLTRMLERLDVNDGDRTLVVGTGTGYSTALLCERLGTKHVVSVDVDRSVADRARERLGIAGYEPVVVAGDGLAGVPDAGPYDRIIAFCAVTEIPHPWVRQCRPGAVIVATLTGALGGFGLARLRADGRGRAQGRVLDDDASFMTARAQANPRPFDLKARMGAAHGPGRHTELSPSVLADSYFRFSAQLAVPDVITFDVRDDDTRSTYVQTLDGRSWARIERTADDSDPSTVTGGGPRRLWDELEAAHHHWEASGRPAPHHYVVTITADHHLVEVSEPN